MSASYLTSDELEEILNFFEDPVLIVPENDSGKSPFYSSRTIQLGSVERDWNAVTLEIASGSGEHPYGFDGDTYTANSNVLDGVGGDNWSGNASRYFIWMDGSVDRVLWSDNNTLTLKETLSGTIGNKNNNDFKSGGILSPIRNFDSQGYFYCNLIGDRIDFQYTASIKDSGYSGSLNFQEI